MTPQSSDLIYQWLASRIFELGERFFSSFITMHSRPLQAANYALQSDTYRSIPKFGILIQGPLVTRHNFTLETVKQYRKMFPHTPVILSVWETEATEHVSALRALGAHVVINKNIDFPGWNNINRQIVGCTTGLVLAKKLKCTYVIKTRPDQRLYGINILPYLYQLLQSFPVAKRTGQKSRIIATSLFTFKYRLYSISDLFLCGHIEDLIAYFHPPQDTRPQIQLSRSILQDSQERIGEMYLSTHFLESHHHPLKWTLADSWKAYREHFLVIDHQSLDLFWYKYQPYKEHRFFEYTAIRNYAQLDFKDWFLLYSQSGKMVIPPEKTIQRGFNDTVTR